MQSSWPRRCGAPILALVFATGLWFACKEEGPDAPPRSNGCIGTDCAPVQTPVIPDANDPAITFGDPLEGTSKKATLVKGGYRFCEGPVWIGGKLLFTEMRANQILKLEANKNVSVFRSNIGTPNGLAVDPGGNLLACETGPRRITRSPDQQGGATRTTIAETFDGNGFNRTNDIVARGDGNIYFTDPIYGGDLVQPDESVYRVSTSGDVLRLAQDFDKPNGIALSADGNTLYVVDNGAGKLYAGAVQPSGDVPEFSVIADVPGGDGMAVDQAGNLYVADDAGIDVFDRTGARKIGTITVAVKASNCTFGGADLKTLYITANGEEPAEGGNPETGLYSISLNVPGLP